ncbi:unnamed protein product [Ilex paraguariensis]|uniref:Uncharacterized protein n=1 Tax=Ilex paraguariensis TaxID=185542 RepID=A0ABC8T5U5_9AQUA
MATDTTHQDQKKRTMEALERRFALAEAELRLQQKKSKKRPGEEINKVALNTNSSSIDASVTQHSSNPLSKKGKAPTALRFCVAANGRRSSQPDLGLSPRCKKTGTQAQSKKAGSELLQSSIEAASAHQDQKKRTMEALERRFALAEAELRLQQKKSKKRPGEEINKVALNTNSSSIDASVTQHSSNPLSKKGKAPTALRFCVAANGRRPSQPDLGLSPRCKKTGTQAQSKKAGSELLQSSIEAASVVSRG